MENRQILLVEDNEDDIELTLHAFRKSNIANKVVVVRDGAEALDFLNGQPGDKAIMPAVVLLDLKLPKIGGLDVLKKIRSSEHTKYVPVVILTSSKEEDDLINSYKLGANSYIRKPVDFDKFVVAVKNLGIYWLVLNEPPPED